MSQGAGSRIALRDFAGQPCKSRLAFEFIPKRKYALDLVLVANQLRGDDIPIEVETPFLLMMTVEGHGVSFFKSGKIIVKDTNEKETARKIAERVLENI